MGNVSKFGKVVILMPAINVSEDAVELIDEYRDQTEWNLSKKDVATKAIEEFHQKHVETKNGGK